MRKKIVMYFGKRELKEDPFETFGLKRSVYHDLFKKGTLRGFDMFIASGRKNYTTPNIFENVFIYNGTIFEAYERQIHADAIIDRSGDMQFPPQEIDIKTLNCLAFKKLCGNKNLTHNLIGQYMPKSTPIQNQNQFFSALHQYNPKQKLVLKPAHGMQGNGIIIDTCENIKSTTLHYNTEYVLQEFVDTSHGIEDITTTYHDLRIIIVNGNITLAHVRTPKQGELLANVALGGTIQEVPLEKIPQFILNVVKKVQLIIDKKFDFPIYSIDFGIQNKNQPFIFELNDQIGFPSEIMSTDDFIENILQSLEYRTIRK